MTHLNIQQGLNISELVNANIIKKLYEAALSVPEPLEGELDAAYMSGRLEVPKSYRSQVLYLAGNINGEPNASGRFADLRIDVTNSYYIGFEDPEVASVLLGTVSTDGIGVSEGDATLITSFSTLGLTNHPSITSFDELKYFTNITSIPQGAFDGTDNITKINLKNISTLGQSSLAWKTQLSNVGLTTNLRTVGKFAFMNDSSLHNIDLTGVTTIELEAFRGTGITDVNCPNLLNLNGSGNFQMSSVQTITDLGSVTILPDSAFWKCTSLTSADISNVVTIKNGTFRGCSSLNNIDLSNVTSIGAHAFDGDSSLSSINIPSSCTSIGNAAFNGCSSITNIDLSNITSLGYSAFKGTSCVKLSFPKLTSIVNQCFSDWPSPLTTVEFGDLMLSIGYEPFWGSLIKTFIFHSTTVPSYSDPYNRNFLYDMSGVTIYVPDASLNDYKTTGLWANMANNIKGLSELSS